MLMLTIENVQGGMILYFFGEEISCRTNQEKPDLAWRAAERMFDLKMRDFKRELAKPEAIERLKLEGEKRPDVFGLNIKSERHRL